MRMNLVDQKRWLRSISALAWAFRFMEKIGAARIKRSAASNFW